MVLGPPAFGGRYVAGLAIRSALRKKQVFCSVWPSATRSAALGLSGSKKKAAVHMHSSLPLFAPKRH